MFEVNFNFCQTWQRLPGRTVTSTWQPRKSVRESWKVPESHRLVKKFILKRVVCSESDVDYVVGLSLLHCSMPAEVLSKTIESQNVYNVVVRWVNNCFSCGILEILSLLQPSAKKGYLMSLFCVQLAGKVAAEQVGAGENLALPRNRSLPLGTGRQRKSKRFRRKIFGSSKRCRRRRLAA